MYQQKQKIILSLTLGMFLLIGGPQYVQAVAVGSVREIRDHNYYFQEYNIKVIESPSIETEFPTWADPDPSQTNRDLAHRVHNVLPFSEDKNEPGYIVYPEHGVVVPVIKPNKYDQDMINNGQLFDHYGYLEQGSLHYFGKSPDQGVGNMVIAAHSSFKKSEPGNYKTVFQALPISLPGDKIFVYLKNQSGVYDFYEYTITSSFETNKYDVSVLRQDVDIPTLTTYGCYTIGSNEDRWINVATLTDMIANHSDLYPKNTQELVQKTSQEHASAYTTQSVNPEEKGKITEKLSQQTIAVDKKPVVSTIPQPTQKQDQIDTVEKTTDSMSVETNSQVPVTLRITYGALIRKTAFNLFQKTIGSPNGMDRIFQLIENLKKGFSPDAFESYVLTMLEEELEDYK